MGSCYIEAAFIFDNLHTLLFDDRRRANKHTPNEGLHVAYATTTTTDGNIRMSTIRVDTHSCERIEQNSGHNAYMFLSNVCCSVFRIC